MDLTDTERPPNVAGAVIFFGYIAAALLFTIIVSRDLIVAYNASLVAANVQDKPKRKDERSRRNLWTFVTLSLISFGTLSYHMLSFLICSYSAWAHGKGIELPVVSFGRGDITNFHETHGSLHIWCWAKSSTLFRDFAEVIVDDPRRFWWTQQALLYSIGWNIFMAVEGTRLRIPRLWAYYVLDQILPISFAQNLFCVAVILSPEPIKSVNLQAAAPGDQFVVVFFYLLCLSAAPGTVGSNSFYAMIFAIRALLYTPYWMSRPTWRESSNVPVTDGETLFWKYRYSAFVLLIGGGFLQAQQSLTALPLRTAIEALHDSPAVGALGYDYLLSLVSLAIFLAAHWRKS